MRAILAFAVLVFAIAFASAAAAQAWSVTVKPDKQNGGDRIILIGDLGGGSALYAQCDGLRAPTLAFISADTHNFPAIQSDKNVQLAFDIDGFASKAVGLYYEHGGGYLGLQIDDRATIAKIVGNIVKAKFGIALTITNPAHSAKMKYTAGLLGAGAAAKQFADYCFKGNQIATPTETPEQPVAAPTSGWRVYKAASGGATVLTGATEPAGDTIYIACNPGKLTLLYLSSKPRELPFNRNAMSVNFVIEIDGFSYSGEAGYYEDERGAGIAFGQYGTIFDMLSVLAIAQTEIKLTLQGANGPLYQRNLVLAGAADAGRQFLDACR